MKIFVIILLSSVFLACGVYTHASGNSAAKSVRNVQKLFAAVLSKKFSLNPTSDISNTDTEFIFNSEEDDEEAEEGKHLLISRDSITELFSFPFDNASQISIAVAFGNRPIFFNHAPFYIAQRVLLI